jgi:hypothetical protein
MFHASIYSTEIALLGQKHLFWVRNGVGVGVPELK